jgi:hypothetical protein
MHRPATRERAAALKELGWTDLAIARELGIARSTLRAWRAGTDAMMTACPRCWQRARPVIMTPADYAYLLGVYLGDGYIVDTPRTQRLRISCDVAHPSVLAEIGTALERTFLWSKVCRVTADDGATTVWSVYSRHLRCLFPQAGPGKKHDRPIVLEPWQARVVASAPWPLLRGLVQSDGCSFINRTGEYAYPSYDFRNRSTDILDLFADTCDSVGIQYRRYAERIRVYRRESVALMREHVGLKG